jgi:hypothetical protein
MGASRQSITDYCPLRIEREIPVRDEAGLAFSLAARLSCVPPSCSISTTLLYAARGAMSRFRATRSPAIGTP